MKILVAEDERATRTRIVACLKALGHEIVEAANGVEAWERLQSEPIGLVISDWLMPEMDGEALIRKIRSQHQRGYVYIIVLTSRSEKEDVLAGMEAGADDFMTKPFHSEELRARIRAGIRVIALEQALAEKNRSLSEANDQLSEAHQTMKDELLAAARIQRSFLPRDLPEFPGVTFAWKYEPCDELGGDTLNIVPFNSHQFGIYVIDVAGHGVSAALLSVHLSRVLTRLDDREALLCRPTEDGRSPVAPSEVAAQLNASLQITASSHQFFTLLYGVLDLKTRRFDFTSAGHPGPLLLSQGETTVFSPTPPAVGFLPDAYFEEQSIALAEGDRLFLYSDGIFEVDDQRGHEWGEGGLATTVNKTAHLSLGETLHTIIEDGKAWQHHARLRDDVSLLAIEIQPMS